MAAEEILEEIIHDNEPMESKAERKKISQRQKQIEKSARAREMNELNEEAQRLSLEIMILRGNGKKGSPEHLALREKLHAAHDQRLQLGWSRMEE